MSARRWLLTGTALAFVLGNAASGALPVSAAGQKVYKIGVDNAAPGTRDWLFVDFFPRADVKVHRGDVLDFKFNPGSLDGLHNVALLASAADRLPFAVGDPDDGPQAVQANPAVFGPSDPTCGSSGNPCSFDGHTRVNSGALPTAPGPEFFVKLDVPASDDGTTVNFFCEIHPGMHGRVTVVPDNARRTSLDELDFLAATQLRSDTRAALDVEEHANANARFANPDGTHTVTVTAGTATPYVEIVEMLPRKVEVERGDKVKFVTRTIRDVHTVTFPQGHGSDGVDPIVNLCEATPNDTPANSPFDCKTPFDFETHILPQPMGTTVIDSIHTIGSSGILGNPAVTPFPKSFAFSFPKEGSFEYQCRIHDHMIGTVVVED